jgi:hypothetical protein
MSSNSSRRATPPVSVDAIFNKLLADGQITVYKIAPDIAERLRAFLASKRSKLSGKFEELGLDRVQQGKVLTYEYDEEKETAIFLFTDRQTKFQFYITDPELAPGTGESPDAPV